MDEIIIGHKDPMQYVRSIEHFMRKMNKKVVVLKARGKHIGKAICIAEASKNRFLKDLNISIGNIKTDTEKFEKDGESRSVVCISIDLTKI